MLFPPVPMNIPNSKIQKGNGPLNEKKPNNEIFYTNESQAEYIRNILQACQHSSCHLPSLESLALRPVHPVNNIIR